METAVRPVELWGDEVVPFDAAGNPLVFWTGGKYVCGACATLAIQAGKPVRVYCVIQGGQRKCDCCPEVIQPVPDADLELEPDLEEEEERPRRAGVTWSTVKASGGWFSDTIRYESCLDPTDADWEQDDSDKEPSEDAEEDRSDWEPDDPLEDADADEDSDPGEDSDPAEDSDPPEDNGDAEPASGRPFRFYSRIVPIENGASL